MGVTQIVGHFPIDLNPDLALDRHFSKPFLDPICVVLVNHNRLRRIDAKYAQLEPLPQTLNERRSFDSTAESAHYVFSHLK